MTPDRAPLNEALELLDRALAYTRGTLLGVRDADLGRPTPCARWDLDALLAHMDDALDAFTEGAGGEVHLDPPGRPVAARVGGLQVKACALLGAWSDPRVPLVVRVGGVGLDTAGLVLAAALEITVHGWDVARATGHATPIPEDLAHHLLPAAGVLVTTADRDVRFAQPLAVAPAASADVRLLAHLGRATSESSATPDWSTGADWRVRQTHRPAAS